MKIQLKSFCLVFAIPLLVVVATVPPASSTAVEGEEDMNTGDTIQAYFSSLKQKKGWEAFLSDDMAFTSFTSPIKRVTGRAAYLEATKRFYSMISALEVKDLLVDGNKACALTRYELQPPGGPAFDSHVAEVFEVRDGKIVSFDIYFDSAPFPR